LLAYTLARYYEIRFKASVYALSLIDEKSQMIWNLHLNTNVVKI